MGTNHSNYAANLSLPSRGPVLGRVGKKEIEGSSRVGGADAVPDQSVRRIRMCVFVYLLRQLYL